MAFRFRLQTVLDLARRERDQHAQVLADKQRTLVAAEGHLAANLQEQEERRQELLAARQGALDPASLAMGQHYLGLLFGQEQERRGMVAEAAEVVEAARTELMAHARKVQVLERLAERARAAYIKEEDRKEAAFLDELATLRHARHGEAQL